MDKNNSEEVKDVADDVREKLDNAIKVATQALKNELNYPSQLSVLVHDDIRQYQEIYERLYPEKNLETKDYPIVLTGKLLKHVLYPEEIAEPLFGDLDNTCYTCGYDGNTLSCNEAIAHIKISHNNVHYVKGTHGCNNEWMKWIYTHRQKHHSSRTFYFTIPGASSLDMVGLLTTDDQAGMMISQAWAIETAPKPASNEIICQITELDVLSYPKLTDTQLSWITGAGVDCDGISHGLPWKALAWSIASGLKRSFLVQVDGNDIGCVLLEASQKYSKKFILTYYFPIGTDDQYIRSALNSIFLHYKKICDNIHTPTIFSVQCNTKNVNKINQLKNMGFKLKGSTYMIMPMED